MRTCETCGFQNAQEGRACSLCGAPEGGGPPPEATPDATPLPTIDLKLHGIQVRGEEIDDVASYEPGTVYAERYRIEELLGRGGMGTVFRVTDRETGRTAALKILHSSVARDRDGRERFQREIEILSRIHHDAVPAILGWGEVRGELYFVTDFVQGEDLRAVLRRRKRFPCAEAAALAATVADALHTAHKLGVVHRDVKPNNLMVADSGKVWLLDFGVARGVGLDLKRITKTGMIVGTPEYMSPEQFDSARADERCDLYSLGVVLFELCTGRLPFDGDSPVTIAMKHRQAAPPSPRALQGDVPAWLDRAILRCLQKDPAKRFASAAELAAELRRARGGLKPQRQELPNGDAMVIDDAESSDSALLLETPRPKEGWAVSMTLLFEGRYYKLEGIDPPEGRGRPWHYRFGYWPEGEVFRKVVDYEVDAAERQAEAEQRLGARVRRWLTRPRE